MISKPKVVITSVPFVDDNTPLAAPAVLKAALLAHNIDCVGLDLNIEIYNKIRNDPRCDLFIDFFYRQIVHEEIVDDLTRMLDFYAEEILKHQPDIVGLSLFCFTCQVFTAWLCARLRHYAPNVRIVIGGPGLQTLENSLIKYPDRLKNLGLIDDYITGDAETSLVNYVLGVDSPGVNSIDWVPNKDLNDSPIPDFSDYTLFHYSYVLLPIVDSRGCVQSCEFCDVIAFWKKFQYLTAENIFQQMLAHIKLYNSYRFQFASSICNGNLREFKKLVQLIADHNKRLTAEEQIHWIGSFIVRSANNHPEELWQLIRDSNGFLLTGVESITEKVRINLGKKFTNQDLEHHLQMAKKYQVPMNLLMIASYPGETEQDYEATKQWFIEHSGFAGNTIKRVQCTLPGILPGTKLEKKVTREEFSKEGPLRYQRAIQLRETIVKCGFEIQTFF